MKSARPVMDTTSASKYFALEMAANVLSWMSNLLHVMDRVYTSFWKSFTAISMLSVTVTKLGMDRRIWPKIHFFIAFLQASYHREVEGIRLENKARRHFMFLLETGTYPALESSWSSWQAGSSLLALWWQTVGGLGLHSSIQRAQRSGGVRKVGTGLLLWLYVRRMGSKHWDYVQEQLELDIWDLARHMSAQLCRGC